ncbi:MAG: hypothetical protein ACOC0J_00390 [Myxococcota bacterium]
MYYAERQAEDGWRMNPIEVVGTEGDTVGGYILAFGQDVAGELYVLTAETHGPTGDSGKVMRIRAPRE